VIVAAEIVLVKVTPNPPATPPVIGVPTPPKIIEPVDPVPTVMLEASDKPVLKFPAPPCIF
jgi:hypothetical protein